MGEKMANIHATIKKRITLIHILYTIYLLYIAVFVYMHKNRSNLDEAAYSHNINPTLISFRNWLHATSKHHGAKGEV